MILIILKNFLKGVSKIKKLCCILCTLLFLFLFAFSKPNINANQIIIDESYDLAYFAPSTISYNFIDSYSFVVPNDYRYNDTGTTSDTINTTMRTYYYRNGNNSFITEMTNVITRGDYYSNNYWGDINDDVKYYIISTFDSIGGSADNLSIGYGFDNITCSADFLKSAYSQGLSLFEVQLPFVNQEYVLEYTINVTAPYAPFSYTASNNFVRTGYLYDNTNIFTDTISLTFGSALYTDLTPYVISSSFGNFIQNLPNDDQRLIMLNVTYKIYVEDWEYMIINEPVFYQRTLTHPFVDLQDYNKGAMGNFLPLELTNAYYMPFGLPTGDSSSFVPNLANSLLIGLQNFLSFELIPGFSLYHVLMLIVAIPLLIFILKLFLGG